MELPLLPLNKRFSGGGTHLMKYFLRLLGILILIGGMVGCGESEPYPVGEPRFGADGRRFQDMSNGKTLIDGGGRAGGMYPNRR